MDLKSYLLTQLEAEAALTRKAVARVPEGRNDFKPHPKSMRRWATLRRWLPACWAGSP